jgi:tetratricopeptide (TPR) repeat protein
MFAALGRHDEAVKAQVQLVLRDPATPQSQFNICSYQLGARLFEAAEATCRTGLLLTPEYLYGHGTLAQVLLEAGKPEAALKEAQAEVDPGYRLVQSAKALDALGRNAESEKALQDMIKNHLEGYDFGPAEVYASRGDADQAFAWLERARLADDPEIGTAHSHGSLTKLHKDPRWLPFLRKLGMAPEQLAKIRFSPKLPG